MNYQFLVQRINEYANQHEIQNIKENESLDEYLRFLNHTNRPYKYKQFYYLIRKWMSDLKIKSTN